MDQKPGIAPETWKRWGLVLLILGLVGLAVCAITTPSFGNDSGAIDRWETDLHATSPEPIAFVHTAAEADQTINRWRTNLYVVDPRQLSPDSATAVFHRRATVTVRGGNVLFPNLVTGTMAIGWDYRRSACRIVDGSLDVNHWGDTNPVALWHWDRDATRVIRGGGINDGGCEYAYRRVHFRFARGIGDFAQEVNPWVSLTVRGNGSCLSDKYESGPHLSC